LQIDKGQRKKKDMLHQLLYVSVETSPYTKEELVSLLKQSRKKNTTLGVTGILLYYKKHFFQVLEGEKDVIFDLFRMIREDERHTSVILMHDQPITERNFKDWTMAFIDLNEIDKRQLEGFSGFLDKSFTSEIGQEHLTLAQELLLKFKNSL
jgi:hypothetical protein